MILDASAVLAYLFREKGAAMVAAQIPKASICAVNLTEVITRVIRNGSTTVEALALVDSLNLRVLNWDDVMVRRASPLSALARSHGISLGDRACLAAGLVTGQPVLTAEHGWKKLPDLGVEIQWIR